MTRKRIFACTHAGAMSSKKKSKIGCKKRQRLIKEINRAILIAAGKEGHYHPMDIDHAGKGYRKWRRRNTRLLIKSASAQQLLPEYDGDIIEGLKK